MKMTTIILISIVLGLGVFLIFRKKNTSPNSDQPLFDKEVKAQDFVKRIEELGYFKYTDATDIDSLKMDIINYYDPDNELTGNWDDKTLTPKDYRYYLCDGEDVFEDGGIMDLLTSLKPTFEKLNFKCIISNYTDEWDDKNNWLNRRITINGTEYIIFKNFEGYGWGEAPMRVSEVLNIELGKQGKDERIYLASGGNDGRLIFLTKELYEYIYSVYKNPSWKPLELSEWQKYNCRPMNLN